MRYSFDTREACDMWMRFENKYICLVYIWPHLSALLPAIWSLYSFLLSLLIVSDASSASGCSVERVGGRLWRLAGLSGDIQQALGKLRIEITHRSITLQQQQQQQSVGPDRQTALIDLIRITHSTELNALWGSDPDTAAGLVAAANVSQYVF